MRDLTKIMQLYVHLKSSIEFIEIIEEDSTNVIDFKYLKKQVKHLANKMSVLEQVLNENDNEIAQANSVMYDATDYIVKEIVANDFKRFVEICNLIKSMDEGIIQIPQVVLDGTTNDKYIFTKLK